MACADINLVTRDGNIPIDREKKMNLSKRARETKKGMYLYCSYNIRPSEEKEMSKLVREREYEAGCLGARCPQQKIFGLKYG